MEEEPIAAAKAAIGSRLREERLRLGMTQADFSAFGGVAKRSAFVIDKEGVIQYSEQTENPGVLPNFEAVQAALAKLQ